MNAKVEYAQMLLNEFKEVCESKDIDYKVVWGPEEIGAGVIMNASDCRRFMETIGEKSDSERSVESWANSSIYPDDTVRYVGTDTICYNILDYDNYNCHGIFIEINIARKQDDSYGGKKTKAILESLKRDSYSFVRKSDGKHEKLKEMLYRRALKKSGGIEGLKKKLIEEILQSADVNLESAAKGDFKFKKYTKDYLANCITDTEIRYKDAFCNEEFRSVLAEELDEMRKLREKIEAHKKSGRANNKKAEKVWNIVCEIDRNIKAEEQVSEEQENPEDNKGAEE